MARVNVDEVADILEGLRQLPELTEVKPAVFYVKRTPFLHFHESATTRGVDVREGKEWGERERDKAIRGMHYFDDVLRSQPFIAGENFSMADITVFAGLAFADAAGIPIDEELTALRQWRVKVSELPAVKQRSGQNFEADDLRRMGF